MKRETFTVADEHDGQTLAAVVRARSEGLSWRKAKQVVRDGKVSLQGAPSVDPATRVRAGMSVRIDPHRRADDSGPKIELVHVDPVLVVVNKPAGMLSVPFEDERDTLMHFAHVALRRHLRKPHLPPLRIVHRLDKDTSGVMVFARTRGAERHLAGLLRSHDIERRYVALCEGRVVAKTHDTHLVADRGDGRRGSWRGAGPPNTAKRAITHVSLQRTFDLGARGRVSKVTCTLETGRQHQIRIHLAEAGNPILGERVYGRPDRPTVIDADRPMLHAEHLGFAHPSRDEVVRFSVAPPDDFASVLARLSR